jgi:hypothetical protein
MEFWVHGVQFDSGVVGGELPVDAFGVVVSPGCPCGDLFANFADAADATAQTLLRRHNITASKHSTHFPHMLNSDSH